MLSKPRKPTRKPVSRVLLIVSAVMLAATVSGCGKTIIISRDELCQSWKHQTISKNDVLTQDTASQIEGSNKARPAWGCQPGENRAKT